MLHHRGRGRPLPHLLQERREPLPDLHRGIPDHRHRFVPPKYPGLALTAPPHACIYSPTGAVLLDQVFLEDTANLWSGQIQEMGFGVMRNGGSQCNAEGYRWKRFRGAPEDRDPFDGTWYGT